MSDPLISLWTAQQADAAALSPRELARRAARLRRRVLLRDATEYLAGMLVIIAFGGIAWFLPPWPMRLACATIIAGTLVTLWNLWRRRPRDDAAALADSAAAHYRRQLVHQRDTLASVGRWYLGPLVPGMLVFTAAMAHARADNLLLAIGNAIFLLAITGGAFGFVLYLNRTAARRLDAEIAALDSAAVPPHSTDNP
jgi:hypothetical protein